jgi:hypothetical protein
MKSLTSYPKLDSLIVNGVIKTDNMTLKTRMMQGLQNIIIWSQPPAALKENLSFFLPLLLSDKIFGEVFKNEERCSAMMKLIFTLIEQSQIEFLAEMKLDINSLLKRLADIVRERKPVERSAKDSDHLLSGVLSLLRSLFSLYPGKRRIYGQDLGLVKELLNNCLFEVKLRNKKKGVPGPKCKSHNTRSAALRLLVVLCKDCAENMREVLEYLIPFHKHAQWRTKRYNDWNIQPKTNEKSATGYVGLKNPACSKKLLSYMYNVCFSF